MDTQEFRRRGREVIEFLVKYHESLSEKRIMHGRIHGYLQSVFPVSAPQNPEDFGNIMKDITHYLIPSIIHWKHPRYFAYFPCGGSYPSILADMLISAVNCAGFSWEGGPAYTELEIVTMNWLGKMIGIPKTFLYSSEASGGGGIFQISGTDAILVTMIAARHEKTKELNKKYPSLDRKGHLPFFIAYCSTISHPSIIKVAEVALVEVRLLKVDKKRRLRGQILEDAIKEDLENGLIPFFVYATLGTTVCCSCDAIEEVGPICKKYGVWLHVDGAYAGSALICPEFRFLIKGTEFADSFSIDPSMWMLMNFDCCAMWVQNRNRLTKAFVVDPLYLQHKFSEKSNAYRYCSISLSRRFRILKLWFVTRIYGVEGLQDYIRNHIHLAQIFGKLIREDGRFIIENDMLFGLVCFRLKSSNALNKQLLSNINSSGKIFLLGTILERNYTLRFSICSENVKEDDVLFAWNTVREETDKIFTTTITRAQSF